MRMYQFAVFLAIFGAVIGALNIAMAYSTHTWFPGTNVSHVASLAGQNVPTYTSSQINSIAPDQRTISEASSNAPQGISSVFFLYSVIQGIFYTKGILDNAIQVPNPYNPSENLFGYFTLILQAGIYIVYVMGGVQIWQKVMLKYSY